MPTTLIIEDSTFFRQLLKETLRSRFPSMAIVEAMDAADAWQKFETHKPDLIFMDIKLPGENGLSLTKKIKARFPEVVIIVLTSYDLPEYREAASNIGADHFLSKGSTTKENILSLVESILFGRRLDSNHYTSKKAY
jgi:DNA-binding NarL/FixJ family response regulator